MMPCQQLHSFQFILLENAEVVPSSQFFPHSPRWEKVSRQNDVEFFHWTLVDIWFCARFFVFSMTSFVFRCEVFK